MNYLFKSIFITAVVLTITMACSNDKADDDEPNELNFKLIYEENFNGDAYNTDYWSSYQTQSWSVAWNHYVVPDDASLAEVKAGNLHLRARWNSETNIPETGAIQTKDKFSFKYGKMEVRAKFTRSGKGGWPAIWLMPQNPVYSSWPLTGEIDVMERLNTDTFVYQVLHQADSGENHISSHQTSPIVADDYNTYGIVKLPNKIELYVNGKRTLTHQPKGLNKDNWPFETDFYIIMNYACADQGQSGIEFWPGLVDNTDNFPYEMAVDYLKVWELVD
ncbi:MAG: hypothetical protein CSA39_03890 [Flavobacteriales bacterium]|nr:MAG: hypothetical protein CSA39_03890 [Flavobacteriales bacterium]